MTRADTAQTDTAGGETARRGAALFRGRHPAASVRWQAPAADGPIRAGRLPSSNSMTSRVLILAVCTNLWARMPGQAS